MFETEPVFKTNKIESEAIFWFNSELCPVICNDTSNKLVELINTSLVK